MRIFISLLTLILATNNIWSKDYNIIPTPQKIETKSDKLAKPKKRVVIVDTTLDIPSEGYILEISKSTIKISAKDSIAIIWAENTLKQLVNPDKKYPQVVITDYPAFPIRGFMHDTGRNFIEVDMLKRHIDLLALYKFNFFHWHLTDNPAWRIECNVYPQLNDPQFQRKGRDEGRFYTYDEIRDIIAYAKERGMGVIPEIDMPGHSKFFNDTFGFSMDSKEGREVLERCLAEFFKEIPASLCPYFHIGSDEVHIADPEGFMKWAENIAQSYGRKAIAWDPGLPASETTIRQIWNEASGANSAAATKPGKFLDSFMGYLNYYDPIIYTNRNFLHNPCNTSQATDNAIGGILCLWNDVNVDDKTKIELHNGMLNGMLPFAERFWHGGTPYPIGEVENLNVLPSPESEAAQNLYKFEEKMIHHRNNILKGENMRWVANASQPWNLEVAGQNIDVWGGAIDLVEVCNVNNIKPTVGQSAIAKSSIYVEQDTIIRAWVGFEVPARSNRLSGGIGEQGAWELGGKVVVNGNEVAPAVKWNEPGAYKFHYHTWHKPAEELPYTDEQLYWMREPAYIHLKRGINVIEVHAPLTFENQRWSFAFIPIMLSEDGTVREATGITFMK